MSREIWYTHQNHKDSFAACRAGESRKCLTLFSCASIDSTSRRSASSPRQALSRIPRGGSRPALTPAEPPLPLAAKILAPLPSPRLTPARAISLRTSGPLHSISGDAEHFLLFVSPSAASAFNASSSATRSGSGSLHTGPRALMKCEPQRRLISDSHGTKQNQSEFASPTTPRRQKVRPVLPVHSAAVHQPETCFVDRAVVCEVILSRASSPRQFQAFSSCVTSWAAGRDISTPVGQQATTATCNCLALAPSPRPQLASRS